MRYAAAPHKAFLNPTRCPLSHELGEGTVRLGDGLLIDFPSYGKVMVIASRFLFDISGRPLPLLFSPFLGPSPSKKRR